MPLPKRRRWFQFSLRTLFVVVTAVACWLGYYINWKHQRRDAREWLVSSRTATNFDAWIDRESHQAEMTRLKSAKMPWGLQLLGEQPLLEVYQVTGADLVANNLSRVFPEAAFHVDSTEDSDDSPQ